MESDKGHSTPLRLEFKEITIDDIPLLRGYFNRGRSRSCDYSIGGVLMWTDYFKYQYAVVDDTLLMRGIDPATGMALYYETPRDGKGERAVSLLCNCGVCGEPRAIVECRQRNCSDVPAEAGSEIEEWKEYLYQLKQFTHFSGKKMEKKRNHLNYFLNNIDYTVKPITPEECGRLIDFTRRFMERHAGSELLDYEGNETIKVLENYHLYGFDGLLIEIDGEIAGYTFGEVIGDTLFAHVEKGNIEYRGIYQALASFMAQHIENSHPEVVYVNRAVDMGDEDLRKSKESYHPCAYVVKTYRHINDICHNIRVGAIKQEIKAQSI